MFVLMHLVDIDANRDNIVLTFLVHGIRMKCCPDEMVPHSENLLSCVHISKIEQLSAQKCDIETDRGIPPVGPLKALLHITVWPKIIHSLTFPPFSTARYSFTQSVYTAERTGAT